MKKVIDKKVYDTEKAKLVASYSNGLSIRDFKHVYEDLYQTKSGQFFLHVQGGPLTSYSIKEGNMTHGVEDIILIYKDDAYEWLENHNKMVEIEEIFPEMISEG